MRNLLATTPLGLTLSGCASLNTDAPKVAVETVDSKFVHVRAVNVTPTDTGFWVRGSVTGSAPLTRTLLKRGAMCSRSVYVQAKQV